MISGVGISINKVTTKWDCLNYGGEWVDEINNFNNLFISMYSLFAIATTDNWANLLYNSIDATSIDYQPKIYNHYIMALPICFFTTFGFLLLLNLFMEVVVSTFHNEKSTIEKVHMITESQKEWV